MARDALLAAVAAKEPFATVVDLLDASSDAVALQKGSGLEFEGRQRSVMTQGELRAFIACFDATALRRVGVGVEDRACVVLRDGCVSACAFFALPTACVFAPVSRTLRASEYEFELTDLGAKVVVVHDGDGEHTAAAVASRLGIAVLAAVPDDGGAAGSFHLEALGSPSGDTGPAVEAGRVAEGPTAMVLHTSGTTARPKAVPLTHRGLCVGAVYISTSLRLSRSDTMLSMMPLFHIHGLAVGLLATIVGGASALVTGGFAAVGVDAVLGHVSGATGFSAVPTMHAALASRGVVATHGLRFARSCSAALPPSVASRVEAVFVGCVAVPTYAMTECMPICANAADASRRLGTVGPPAGPEVRIFDGDGNEANLGVRGRVCVRGDCLMAGYEPRDGFDPNADAYVGDTWLVTGDLGSLDRDGHLTLEGRSKETINRGGETISPFAVEHALLTHVAVREVVAFAAPHASLGECVGVLVSLAPGRVTNLAELRAWASRSLSVGLPEVLVVAASVPLGPTGKPSRLGLADALRLPTVDGRATFDAGSLGASLGASLSLLTLGGVTTRA